jgi:hypothetical protein
MGRVANPCDFLDGIQLVSNGHLTSVSNGFLTGAKKDWKIRQIGLVSKPLSSAKSRICKAGVASSILVGSNSREDKHCALRESARPSFARFHPSQLSYGFHLLTQSPTALGIICAAYGDDPQLPKWDESASAARSARTVTAACASQG